MVAASSAIYTLSLHDALPISWVSTPMCATLSSSTSAPAAHSTRPPSTTAKSGAAAASRLDRKSTRLNSSHLGISYAVFCLKKKKKKQTTTTLQKPTKYYDILT